MNDEINIVTINGKKACWVFSRVNHSFQLLKNLSLWNFRFSFSNNLAFLAKDFVTHFSKGIFFMNEDLNSNNIENDYINLKNEDSDFKELITRLKEIKSTIALLEKTKVK